MEKNLLYYGDNLDILRRYLQEESVDLIYLDPPFNSNQTYNVLFSEQDGSAAASQIKAFDDTWTYDEQAARAYEEVLSGPADAAKVVRAFRDFLGASNMMAYLANMAVRLIELRRVLKPTGSLYLHCDPTASHYLKILLDAVFGPQNFRTEIVWKRSSAHSDTKQGRKQHGRVHDTIFFYTKSEDWTWNPSYTEYEEHYVRSFYRHIEPETGRKFRIDNLSAARPGGDTRYEWRVKRFANGAWEHDLENEYLHPKTEVEYKGIFPYKNRYWAYSREKMAAFSNEGRIVYSKTGMPCYKRYLDEMPGVSLQDIWVDITQIGSGSTERLGYPTQKPEALLERIIQASSNEGDTVLDPFCGCGTAVAVAQRLNRRWIGIDITHLAINLIRTRLIDAFGENAEFEVIGEPVSLPDAEALARQDPWQFQWWALGLGGARPVEQKKGADKGIDGRLYFHDEGHHGKTKQVIISVKAGHASVQHVRDLRGVLDREGAEIGVLITMQEPTKPMKTEAASAGFYEARGVGFEGHHYPRLQILSIEELLAGKTIEYPKFYRSNVTFKKAKKAKPSEKGHSRQMRLEDAE